MTQSLPMPLPDTIRVYCKQNGKLEVYNVSNSGSYAEAIKLVEDELMVDSTPYAGSVLALAKG